MIGTTYVFTLKKAVNGLLVNASDKPSTMRIKKNKLAVTDPQCFPCDSHRRQSIVGVGHNGTNVHKVCKTSQNQRHCTLDYFLRENANADTRNEPNNRLKDSQKLCDGASKNFRAEHSWKNMTKDIPENPTWTIRDDWGAKAKKKWWLSNLFHSKRIETTWNVELRDVGTANFTTTF